MFTGRFVDRAELFAGCAVQGEAGGRGVRAAVVGIEPDADGAAGADDAIVAGVVDRHQRTGLGKCAVPQARDRLIAWKGPGECPGINGGRTGIRQRDSGGET